MGRKREKVDVTCYQEQKKQPRVDKKETNQKKIVQIKKKRMGYTRADDPNCF